MQILDFEAHYYSEAMYEQMCARTEYPLCENNTYFRYTDDFYTRVTPELFLHSDDYVKARLDSMDSCCVNKQILGMSHGLEELPVNQSIACAKATNDLIYRVSQMNPGRFLCFGTFPIGDTAAAVEEMERCKKELSFVGWMTFSNFRSSYIDEPRYLPLLEAAECLGLPIYIHPCPPSIERLSGLGHTMAGGAMGFTIDTAITVSRLIYQGIFDRFPLLQVIMGHLGEGLPYSLDRMDQISRKQVAVVNTNKHDPSYYFKHNIWVTTSGVFSNETFTCARDVLGIDRILFGSDYPYEPLGKAVDFVKELPISESDRALIMSKNAEKLFALCK